VDLTGDDRAMIYGALIWMAEKLKSEDGEHGAANSGPKRERGVRGGTSGRTADDIAPAAGSGVTDGGRRGDLTYRSAARHRAATPRLTK
jgi:hypothetical protein